MKYWWILDYIPFFENIDRATLRSKKGKETLNQFLSDYSYHCTIPVHYLSYFKKIKNYPISQLSDCGLQMMLAYYIYQGKIEEGLLEEALLNHRIFDLLMAMKKIPDTSLPATDYTISEMVEEIKHLPSLIPTVEKVKSSNIGACYHCRNIFYIDAIYQKNKKGECLCPYCDSTTLFFDSDYIPMDSNFLMLAYLIYQKEVSFQDLILMLDKVSIEEKGPIDYSFSNGNYQIELGHISFPLIEEKANVTSIYEDYLSTSLYHILNYHDHHPISKSISISLDGIHSKEQSYVFAISSFLSILYYFSRHYFHSIEKIHIVITDSTIRSIYKKTIQELKEIETKNES